MRGLTIVNDRRREAIARVSARVDWLAVGALVILAVFLAPTLRVGYRGDDTWTSELRGELKLNGHSLVDQLRESAETFWNSGRPNVLGTSQGLLTARYLGDDPLAYHLVLLLLTLAAAAILYALSRELGFSRRAALLVMTLLAGAIQVRSYHDALLGYWGTTQLVLILSLASFYALARGLRENRRRLQLASLVLFLPCPWLYEAAYGLVAVHVGVVLMHRRGRAAIGPALPFVALGMGFVLLSVLLRTTASGVTPGYQVGGGPLEMLRIYVIQLFAPIPASNVFFRADYGTFLPLGTDPTRPELVGAAWRGLVVFTAALWLSLGLAGRNRTNLPTQAATRAVALTGLLLWTSAVVVISAAPKYQYELVAGKGHLPALMQVFGWALAGAAGLLTVLRIARERSVAAGRVTAVAASTIIGFAAGVVGFNNLRVVALETPVVKTRQLLENGVAAGVLRDLPDRSSVVFSGADMAWPTGHWSQSPVALDSMLRDRAGRAFDGRVYNGPDQPSCTRSSSFPPDDCAPLGHIAAWVRVRAHRGGGTVIVADLKPDPPADPTTVSVERLHVFARGDSAGAAPMVVGLTASGRPWNSGRLKWRRVRHGDDWAIYAASMPKATRPLAGTVDDPRGVVNFSDLGPPDEIVRRFGTKRLLP